MCLGILVYFFKLLLPNRSWLFTKLSCSAREAAVWPLTSTWCCQEWMDLYIYYPPYVFVSWCSFKHKNSLFVFILPISRADNGFWHAWQQVFSIASFDKKVISISSRHSQLAQQFIIPPIRQHETATHSLISIVIGVHTDLDFRRSEYMHISATL